MDATQEPLLLPSTVLVSGLQHVPVAHRLSSCALVSTSWAQAAAEATSSIDFEGRSSSHADSLQQYLQRWGDHVTSFAYFLSTPAGPSTDPAGTASGILSQQLPCPRLLELQLNPLDHELQLGPCSGRPGLLHAATGLTLLSLSLQDKPAISLSGGTQALTVLTALRSLQHLSFTAMEDHFAVQDQEPEAADVMPSSVLRHLQQLTALYLTGALGLDSLQPISCLKKLRSLGIELGFHIPETAAAGSSSVGDIQRQLQQQLSLQGAPEQQQQQQQEEQQQQQQQLAQMTYLRLAVPALDISGSSYPWLQGLAGVEVLELVGGVLDSQILWAMTGLQCLDLKSVALVGGAAGEAVLCSCISSFKHLTALALTDMEGSAPFAAACAAVRSSSCSRRAGDSTSSNSVGVCSTSKRDWLAFLSLTGAEVPEDGWQQLFPAGRCLPELYHLQIDAKVGQFTDGDLAALAQCCPNVAQLCIARTAAHMDEAPVAIGWHELLLELAPLRQLTQCTSLIITGVSDQNLAAGVGPADVQLCPGVLAELTSLRSLMILPPSVATTRSILMLSALTQLAYLRIETCGTYYAEKIQVIIEAEAQPPALPDVWCRVIEYCCNDPICRDKLLQDEADVLQKMQDVGYGTGFMQLVCEEARARARAAELRTEVLQWHMSAFARPLALTEDELPPGW